MTRDEAHAELVDSLRADALELDTLDPDTGFADLRAFDDALADVSVVGLGEATHRARECFRFKHRFLRYLVEVHGFRAFALEAPFSETMALHEYVAGERDDLQRILDRIGFRIYQTEEMVAVLRWLRSFNENRPAADRVELYGFDVQSAAGAAAALRATLGDVNEAPPERILDALDTAADGVFEGQDVDRIRLRTAERAAAELREWFDASSADETDAPVASQHLRTLRRACEFARTGLAADRPTQWGLRDQYMAAGVAWIRGHTTGRGVAVWAHDNHVKRGELSGAGHPAATMGEHLAKRYGRGYYALSAQFGRGTARAFTETDGEGDVEADGRSYAMTELSVPEPTEGSIPGLLDRLDAPNALLDYRSLSTDSALRDWLAQSRPHRFVTGVVDPDEEAAFTRHHHAIEAFDGVFFVRDATPSTPY